MVKIEKCNKKITEIITEIVLNFTYDLTKLISYKDQMIYILVLSGALSALILSI